MGARVEGGWSRVEGGRQRVPSVLAWMLLGQAVKLGACAAASSASSAKAAAARSASGRRGIRRQCHELDLRDAISRPPRARHCLGLSSQEEHEKCDRGCPNCLVSAPASVRRRLWPRLPLHGSRVPMVVAGWI